MSNTQIKQGKTETVLAETTTGTVTTKMTGSEGFKEVSGGSASRDREIILKQDTIYLREFISGSDDNVICFRASWHEHENAN